MGYGFGGGCNNYTPFIIFLVLILLLGGGGGYGCHDVDQK